MVGQLSCIKDSIGFTIATKIIQLQLQTLQHFLLLILIMSNRQFHLTVLISGNGSNLQALIDACSSGALPNTKITHVISK